MSRNWIVLLLILLTTLLTGCGVEAWERDPVARAAITSNWRASPSPSQGHGS